MQPLQGSIYSSLAIWPPLHGLYFQMVSRGLRPVPLNKHGQALPCGPPEGILHLQVMVAGPLNKHGVTSWPRGAGCTLGLCFQPSPGRESEPDMGRGCEASSTRGLHYNYKAPAQSGRGEVPTRVMQPFAVGMFLQDGHSQTDVATHVSGRVGGGGFPGQETNGICIYIKLFNRWCYSDKADIISHTNVMEQKAKLSYGNNIVKETSIIRNPIETNIRNTIPINNTKII